MTPARIPAIDKDGNPARSVIVTTSNAAAFAIKQRSRELRRHPA